MIFIFNIYDIKKIIKVMKSMKEKVSVSISIDTKLDNYMNEMFSNRSKYIEWLIEQDLLKNNIDLKKIII